MSPWRRRLITVPAVSLAFVLFTLGVPLWLPGGLLVGLLRQRRFALLRLLAFGWLYSSMQVAGLLRIGAAVLLHRGRPAQLRGAVYEIQGWWADRLYRGMCGCFGMRFATDGDGVLREGPVLLLLQHTSIMDTLIPSALVAAPHGLRLRYILKKELLFDPCLDVAGHILPNHFVDRSEPGSGDPAAIQALVQGLSAEEGAVIYPEGTRFSEVKRARILAKLQARKPQLHAVAQRLQRTLPPRLGGVAALLDGAPQADVVVCAHQGLAGLSTLKDLTNGAIVGRTVQVGFWRIPADQVPRRREEREAWLLGVWEEVDRRTRLAEGASD